MISVGGDQLDRQFAEQLQVDVAEARDRRRRQAGAWTDEADPSDPQAGQTSDALAMAASRRGGVATLDAATPQPETIAAEGEMLDCLIDELRLCAGYHASLFANRPIGRVVFLGGEAHQAGMCRRIARTLDATGELGDPLGALPRAAEACPPVDVDLRHPQPAWAVPLGLCCLAEAGGAA
jgi:Tfp pilus assembly PilM family ATPase